MGTKFYEVVCDENGIGGSGEYCGENDAAIPRMILRVGGAHWCFYRGQF
jgi:hypothetical protein